MEIGNPAALHIDYDSNIYSFNYRKTDRDLIELISDQLSKYSEATVFLSGGLDSQFSLQMANKFIPNVKAVTFAYTWDGYIINADDVLNAENIAKHLNVSHQVETYDLKRFLDNDLSETSKKYVIGSPQISAHVYAVENSKHLSEVNILGGELPFVGLDGLGNVSPRYAQDGTDRQNTHPNLYMYTIFPFMQLANQQGINIIRDMFMLSDEIWYAAHMHNVKVINESGKIFKFYQQPKDSYWLYKNEFYKKFGFDYVQPLAKRTGFEYLKMHLASQTGNYLEFDIKYRDTLKKNLGKRKQLRVKYNGDYEEMLSLIRDQIDLDKCEACNIYVFDW